MHIEKTTRIISAYTPSRSHCATEKKRLIPLSLPRVKWLESDPMMAAKYTNEGDVNSWKETDDEITKNKVEPDYLNKDASVVPMRNCDRRAYDLRVNHNMTYEQISRELKIGNSTVRNHFARAMNCIKQYYEKLESQGV